MSSKEENVLLTRTGPGTPMGGLLLRPARPHHGAGEPSRLF